MLIYYKGAQLSSQLQKQVLKTLKNFTKEERQDG